MSESTIAIKDLVEFVAKALVDRPEEVTVDEVPEAGGIVLELEVAEEDLGKVIGRQGRTARALRALVSASATKSRTQISLEILE